MIEEFLGLSKYDIFEMDKYMEVLKNITHEEFHKYFQHIVKY